MKEKRDVAICVKCALCNGGDAAYRRTLLEKSSPRHAVWSLKQGKPSKMLYTLMLNGRAEARCPLNIGLEAAIIEGREMLLHEGKETPENRKMIEKIRKGKNPYS